MKATIAALPDYELYAHILQRFWAYFTTTWIRRYKPASWNITGACEGLGDPHDVLINRTNNPLESFNSRMKVKFPTTPTMVNFIIGIKEISCEKINDLRLIREGRSVPKKKAPVKIRKPPSDYATFIPPSPDREDSDNDNSPPIQRKKRRQN